MITQDLIKKIKNGMYDETLKDVIQNILEREKSLSLVHREEVK